MNKQDKAAITAAKKAIAEAQAARDTAFTLLAAGCKTVREAISEELRLVSISDEACRKARRMESDLKELKQSIKDRAKL